MGVAAVVVGVAAVVVAAVAVAVAVAAVAVEEDGVETKLLIIRKFSKGPKIG